MDSLLGLLLTLLPFFSLHVTARLHDTPSFSHKRSRPTHNGSQIDPPFWLADIQHQGVAPFQTDAYQVFRNVKDFGAKGDGISDDTAAINLAISSGDRCAPGKCQSSTTSPALVYFPAGTYIVSKPIVDYYFTQIIGNPKSLPVIKATANFTGAFVIDGDMYGSTGALGYNATVVFYRQIRNLVIDTTAAPSNLSLTGIHWPTSQATSLQNIDFRMSKTNGTLQQGLLVESGSGGFMGDLSFTGGMVGATFANQQFTTRNMAFNGCQQAINQAFDWGWTYKSITINNCKVGINMTSGGIDNQAAGAVVVLDSKIENTPVGVLTAYSKKYSAMSNGSLVLENVKLKNVGIAVQGAGNVTALAGTAGVERIVAWAQGHEYTPAGRSIIQGSIPAVSRPTGLVQGEKYYEYSKPSYAGYAASQFLSVRSQGAKGDSMTDDTAALQRAINAAVSTKRILFIDFGIYRVTKTLHVPSEAKIVGEAYPVILSSGPHFANMHSPKPVVQVGRPGDVGCVQWSDTIVSTQGAQAGAILIEWNLATYGTPSGMWDVHTRIGGFKGSKFQLADCPAAPALGLNSTSPRNSSMPSAPFSNSTATNSSSASVQIDKSCIAAFLSMHITPSASNLYLENNWFWTADHDLDPPNQSPTLNSNLTIYTGRGFLDESQRGKIWLYATAAEHSSLYQFQFTNTHSVFASQLQTETAYYQPDPDVTKPFKISKQYHDPTVSEICLGTKKHCDGLALRIHDSQELEIYGAGLYAFYDAYNVTCSFHDDCQDSIFSIEQSQVNLFDLHTVGVENMVDLNGKSLAKAEDNDSGFSDGIAVLRVP